MTAAVLSLCSGYAGLDLAVEEVLDARTRWFAEVDPHASRVLRAHYPGVPNLGDLTAADWTAPDWSTIDADIITAGYPCQPFSTAGHRRGTEDARHIWPHIARIVRTVRPRLVVLENVVGHLTLGFGVVLADLASAGFDAEWSVLRASDVGAAHRRARVFIVATDPAGERREGMERAEPGPAAGTGRTRGATPRDGATADADSDRRQEFGEHDARYGRLDDRVVASRHDPARRGPDHHRPNDATSVPAPDADSAGRERRDRRSEQSRRSIARPDRAAAWGDYWPAVERWEHVVGRAAPPILNRHGRLSAVFVEWLMGLPAGWVTAVLSNSMALHVLGNGVVPQQAAAALRILLAQRDEEVAA